MDSHPEKMINSLDDLIRQLHRVFDADKVDVDYVMELMQSYKSNPAEWRKFAKYDRYRRWKHVTFNHPIRNLENMYTRNLVDEGNGKFNLMLLCWGEGHASAIHDHSNAHCFMKMLDGSLREIRFDWPEEKTSTENSSQNEENPFNELKQIGNSEMKVNDVLYINDTMGLHRVENPSHTSRAASLHLYCPPFDSCHMFDQRTGKKTSCKVTFWSKFGEKVPMIKAPASCVTPVSQSS